jgi:hypothetical protein
MINAQEIQYPDGTKVEKLNLVSNDITLSKMDKVDWSGLFDGDNILTPQLAMHCLDCFFTLTPKLKLIDESGNTHNLSDFQIGEIIKYNGEEFEIYNTEEIAGLFEYILTETAKIRKDMENTGVN